MQPQPGSLLLALLLCLLALLATAEDPKYTSTPFDVEPKNLLYFEDSDTILIRNPKTLTTYRSDDGGVEWKPLDGVDEGVIIEVLRHPYGKNVAVVFGKEKRHWITYDQGKSWRSFETEYLPSSKRPGINFHAADPDRMLFLAEKCQFSFCEDHVYYTTDGFKTPPKELSEPVYNCMWAKTTDVFTTGDAQLDKDTILCIAPDKYLSFSTSNRVLITSDYFASEAREPVMKDMKPVRGVTNLAAVQRYFVFASKSEHTTELALQVTLDTRTWHRAEFGEHRLEQNAYTLLESTNYSMQIDVQDRRLGMGSLLTSESNGTFFTRTLEHTNRNEWGFTDFVQVARVQGVMLANVVDNWKDVEANPTIEKKLKSQISFDDGRTWVSPQTDDGKDLYLHSITDQRNTGRIYSSPAPGVMMGVGNTGEYLREYAEGDLYVSHDAGLSWTRAFRRPHLYEFGASGSVLVAAEWGVDTDELKWSLDFGQKWQTTKLQDKVKPLLLTTTPDSTSLKFVMTAARGGGSDTSYLIYSFDFAGLHERECSDKDMELWWARTNKAGEAQCLMGHKQGFLRRKLDADCLVRVEAFKDPESKTEDCPCSDSDFECDYNFVREDGQCVPYGSVAVPPDACKDGEETFEGPPRYRLIPGNTCKYDGGKQLDNESKEWSCKNSTSGRVSGKVSSTMTEFAGDNFIEHYYLERSYSNSGVDETVIMRTSRREAWLTKDHGKTWKRLLEEESVEVLAIYHHQYLDEAFYLITPSEKVYYSTNRGNTIHSFKRPALPNVNQLDLLQFHPTESDWLIWTGRQDCDRLDQDCMNVAYITRKLGLSWEPLLRNVRKCQFVYREDRPGSDELVYCEQFDEESLRAPVSLLSSDDWFARKNRLKRDVVNFATMAEYIVVAERDEDQRSLKVDTSIDGITFADAKFPRNFQVPHQQAYTVLDSSTHAVFLHVTVDNQPGQEYGSIIKSNSNGTSYVLSIADVNRNELGFVDFEKAQGLEGVILINRVANVKDTNEGGSKKLKTYITHNDGAGWAYIKRPEDPPKDVGEPFECQDSGEDCSLHLHGYTERVHPRNTFGSPSAVGIMLGTGNVGKFLGDKRDADTFITTDGGITWRLVQKGNWMWKFGDQGSVIVIVKENEATRSLFFTLDEGANWSQHDFSDQMMLVSAITTVPSDTSLNFLLWGKIGSTLVTVNIDFSQLNERSTQCKLDDDNPRAEDSDYTLWSPKHPLSEDDCLFGHVAEYHRKKPESKCYNGREIQHLHAISKNCSCTREDYECDYNYEPGANGECTLVEGAKKPDPAEECAKNPALKEYNEITGFRRIPLTTCVGGDELDKRLKTFPCPGHQKEYDDKHGISGAGLFFAITLPIAAAAGIGYWVWQRWDGKFGRIRLGDGGGGGMAGRTHLVAFDRDAPWVQYPVMLLSGVVAVVAALPMLAATLWRAVSTRMGRGGGGGRGGVGGGGLGGYTRPFTSRGSFQRGRGGYAVVDPDEGELLGDDSDDDM